MFLANWLLYKAGAMSYLPWVNNFLHTFVWIGFMLSWLYLGVRERESLLVTVKRDLRDVQPDREVRRAGQLFGTWEHDNFFGIDGNGAYVLGWSIADGTYPLLTQFVLRRAAARHPGPRDHLTSVRRPRRGCASASPPRTR